MYYAILWDYANAPEGISKKKEKGTDKTVIITIKFLKYFSIHA